MFSYALAKREFDAAPLFVAAASAPDNLHGLVRGLLQLAPDERMTCDAALGHPLFATELAPIVSVAAADRGSFSVVQGKLEPQLLEWLQADPYWTHIINVLRDQPASKRSRGSVASVERPTYSKRAAIRDTSRLRAPSVA